MAKKNDTKQTTTQAIRHFLGRAPRVRPLTKAKKIYVGDPAADGVRAAKTDNAVARARATGNGDALAEIETSIGSTEFTRRYGMRDALLAEAVVLATRQVAGHQITLVAGVQYRASRPFATRGRREFPVTIEAIDGSGATSVTIAKLNYDAADRLVNAFNNGDMSFDGRRW